MERKITAAFAAAALIALTGCGGRHKAVTEVSTNETTAGMTSDYTAQSLLADTVTTDEKNIVTTSSIPQKNESVSTSEAESDGDNAAASQKTYSAGEPQSPSETSPSSHTSASAQESTQPSEAPTKGSPSREDVINAYKDAVSENIDTALKSGGESVSVAYTLFDMDRNSIPELIIKCGTGDEDYQYTFYTYDEFGVKVVSDGMAGGHSGFAYDTETNQFVSAYSFMGNGVLTWYSFDGSSIDTLKTAEFEYSGEDTFESQSEKLGVQLIPFALYTNNSYEELTWVYRVVTGGLEYDEISGKDFSFIDNYNF